MNLESLTDFADTAANEIAKYKISFILNPDKITANNYPIAFLDWHSISYGEKELDKVPNDKRGVYAFAICQHSDVLPTHGYILYIGIAGRDSERSLRARYRDYLNEKKVMKRPHIARMIGNWHELLRFYFAPVGDDVSSDNLKTLEKQLNTALMPPFAKGDLEADTKQKRSAFP